MMFESIPLQFITTNEGCKLIFFLKIKINAFTFKDLIYEKESRMKKKGKKMTFYSTKKVDNL